MIEDFTIYLLWSLPGEIIPLHLKFDTTDRPIEGSSAEMETTHFRRKVAARDIKEAGAEVRGEIEEINGDQRAK